MYKPELEYYCYKDLKYNLLSADITSEIARLTLRVNIKRKINVEDWKYTLRKGIKYKCEVLNREVNSIHEKPSHKCSCISGLDGETLEQRLKEKGHRVNLANIEEFYHPTPLEILDERLAKGDIPNEEAEKLVKDHLEYVKNYILISKNRDQAYYQWTYDKVPSLRKIIDLEEIRNLNVLLHPYDFE